MRYVEITGFDKEEKERLEVKEEILNLRINREERKPKERKGRNICLQLIIRGERVGSKM